jgi:hypothetical protein
MTKDIYAKSAARAARQIADEEDKFVYIEILKVMGMLHMEQTQDQDISYDEF